MAADIVGMVVGRLTVISHVGGLKWLCVCECGEQITAFRSNLVTGRSTSCGCRRKETLSRVRTTHGKRSSSEYRVWLGMKQRCLNPKNPSYSYYGGRGIRVCDSWVGSFEMFLSDMGPRPSLAYSIDRRNNDGNYEPGNCIWATHTEQMNNTRRNIRSA